MARYGLAPQHTYRDAYPFVTEAYRRLVARVGADATTILGDSAGGGLALGLAQTLEEAGLPQPRLLMLLAPWVDLTLEDPAIPPVEADDPWLTRIGLVEAGRAWAGGDDPPAAAAQPHRGIRRRARARPRLRRHPRCPVAGRAPAAAPVRGGRASAATASASPWRRERCTTTRCCPTPEGRLAERAILREIAG